MCLNPYLPIALSGIQRLRSLSFMAIDNVDDGLCEAIDLHYLAIDGFREVAEFITLNMSTLRTLILPGEEIWNLPVRAFSSLTELDIVDSFELSGLDLIFHHAVHLQSLIIQGEEDGEFYRVLQNNSSALPSLTSLKIISFISHTEEQLLAVKAFIQGRSLLRRLDLSLNPIDWATFASMLSAISDLHGLKALGITMHLAISTKEYTHFVQHFPNELEAIRLRVDLSDPVLDRGPLSVIVSYQFITSKARMLKASWQMEKLRQMPSLAFLSLHRYGASKLYAFADDIASDCQQLSLLYLDRDIWNVDRSESEIKLFPWSIRRKVLKIKEDFENEDAEWLLRHGEFPVSLCGP